MANMVFIILIFTALASPQTYAADPPPRGTFITMKQTGTATVTNIIDPYTLTLDDGRTVRLSGINIPDFKPHQTGDIAALSMNILRDMLVGQDINLYQTKTKDLGRVNRLGHHLAHIERASDTAWVQGALLRLGLARVHTEKRTPDMAHQMYTLETAAREENLGLWSVESHHIRKAPNTNNHLDSFQIVEGTIKSAALKNNRIYLNFGADWRQDFTVSIAPEDKRSFSKAGLDPLTWNGLTVRIRGWIRHYNGPYMEITHPQAVEFLGEKQ